LGGFIRAAKRNWRCRLAHLIHHASRRFRQGQAMDGLTEGELYASEQFAPDENDDITDEG
jgi:hypothetical protein